MSPFITNYGYNPRPDTLAPPSGPSLKLPNLVQHIRDLQDVHRAARTAMQQAQQDYKRYADRTRQDHS
ncbi:hypothetical protein RI367_004835, partial [Sorochytrium milnesiophthora]